MSPTFDIFPTHDVVPAFEAVVSRAEAHLDQYLRANGIFVHLDLRASIRTSEPDAELVATAAGPMQWDDASYAWFRVEGFAGGAHAHFWARNSVVTREYLEQSLIPRRPELAKTLDVGRHWNIRPSEGATAVVRAASGFIAAAIAELTEGLVFSDDGACVQEFGVTGEWIVRLKEELLGDD